ncbi:unnamed protein product [Leuciscus chuanchicus]
MSLNENLCYLADPGSSFTEDAPRPPVPGEEGDLVSSDGRPQYSHTFYSSKSESLKNEAPIATPRRPDLDLGYEPEGSASPTPPYLKWAESLHSLLDDQDGIHLFRTFLKQEECADMLDFWFACSGFRKQENNEGNEKMLKLAKAIYKKYILDNNGIVSRQIKSATKSFIKDCVMKLHIDPAMFDQAQTEIQTMMEENTYPLFLKSDIYLEYTRTGGESPKLFSDQSSVSGNGKILPGYLPTVKEDEEWKCDQEQDLNSESDPTPSNRLTQKLLMETVPQRVANSKRYQDNREYRDGVPPYRYRKPHRREIHESAKVNGRVPLPHIPRTNRIPKDIHVEPEKFAAELISRLEGVLREREAQEKLEERLKRVRLEEEGDDADVSTAPSLANHRFPPAVHMQHYGGRYSETSYNGLQLRDAHEENPESILDEHVQRVMKTPGCQSPGTGRHSPKSRSPDGLPAGKNPGLIMPLSGGQGKHQARLGPKADAAHLHHHKHVYHTHYAAGGKPKEQVEVEPSKVHGGLAWNTEQHHYGSKSRNYADGMSVGPNGMDPMGYGSKGSTLSKRPVRKGEDGRNYEMREPLPLDDMERNQKILQWMMEGEKEAGRYKRSPYGSISGSKKAPSHEVSRPSSVERPGAVHPWVTAQLRNSVQPSHPFIQDPTMPPNPAPNPLTQLEEARRRLEEERRKSGTLQAKQRHKNMKKQPCENITVAYYFCGEPIPYRTSVKGRIVTLGQFKELLTKKGSYRYYFKKVSDEFDCGVVFEEVREDDAILPIFEEKIIGKVEKID